ncbi:GlxA family transcriptional regulator [Pantoea agglomerans]|jgi:transcriptional regulator GlxA family with amidase domain|uniref:GlxA family transcriptional regulator n=1 Tax=Pantoea TaxID=53335 RepID=UPI000F03F594|nr:MULTISPECIES: helix-turn-helix domain-containing protein [Pantoea]AYP25623.1 helix-turn-helix domain-containing protein [Pantoea agglomerans]MCL6413105.1 helix-turn-helix domain-containing protein [Pantoea agglomerans]MCX2194580.1 helix-turn-helix domain-containing protein [Pantoea agglomerans]MDQ0551781.1 transcriptional regulator GlxA family with amidase domain [Pantoea agglomerans]UVV75267.1 helix-turn-helix domain-containing protein [Pantoea agglomerans]
MAALRVAVLATAGFSPFHFSVPCILFGSALPQPDLFHVDICALKPGPVISEMGLSITVEQGLDPLDQADIIIVPYWHNPAEKPAQALLDKLVAAWQRGAEIVGLCLGTYVLAYAGLLDKHRAATHWEFERDFSERFPQVHLDSNALYTRDTRLITSAGTAAGIDCCLDIIRHHYGSAMANRVARRMVVPPYREGGQAQFIERPVPETTRDSKINALLASLRQNLHQPQDLDSLSRTLGMSRRTLTRHFHKATGMSLGEWLTAERLQRSQLLLETTGISIECVAEKAGFDSPVSFRQRFKSRFGVSPSEWRRTFRGPHPVMSDETLRQDDE